MNTLELQEFLDRCYVYNTNIIVCAIDELPEKKLKNKKKNYGIVINLSKKNEFGSHWVGMFISKSYRHDDRRNGFFLDSYGFTPRSWYLTDFIKKNCHHVEYCERQLQQLHSNVCGMYVSCFIIHMANGNQFQHFVDKFSKNLLINDHFIVTIYNYYKRN